MDWTPQRQRLLLGAWIALAAVLLVVDHEIGPRIQFPVFFLVPVLLAAWFNGLAWGLGFAFALAVARLVFRVLGWEAPWSLVDTLVNAGIRFIVFAMAAFMIDRIASQRRLLGRRLDLVLETLPVGVWITDARGNFVSSNPAARAIWGGERKVGPEGYNEYRGWWPETGKPVAAEEWAFSRAIRRGETIVGQLVEIEGFDGVRRSIRNSAAPLRDERGRILGAVVLNVDVTNEERSAKEREELVARLQEALEQVKTLGGLIPICAGCKKIRNDAGYWIRIETYVKEHSEADFSHGLCPECLERLYPDLLD